MTHTLFHADNEIYFDLDGLRDYARNVVRRSRLIDEARSGDKTAAIALKIGFWPFVREFEGAIDQQKLPRRPLQEKFGTARMRETFVEIARALKEMKREEGSHAAHWLKDAECLGLGALGDDRVPGVHALISSAYTTDLPRFFSMLAGTELVAEELSRTLVESRRFTQLFSRRRWMWGEVHLAPHEHGPSHLAIDLDLARAYAEMAPASAIERLIVGTIDLFGQAATDIEASLVPSVRACSETHNHRTATARSTGHRFGSAAETNRLPFTPPGATAA